MSIMCIRICSVCASFGYLPSLSLYFLNVCCELESNLLLSNRKQSEDLRMSLPRSMSTPGVISQGKVLRRPNRPGSLKISQQANLNRLSSMSSMSSMEMSNLEDTVVTMENICRHLVNKNYSLTVLSALSGLYTTLHHHGLQLDTMYKDQLDKLMSVFRTVCRDEELDLVSRVQILHIIELRAAGWVTNDNMSTYYKQKLSMIDTNNDHNMRDSPLLQTIQTAPVSLNANAPDFTPGSGSCLLLPGEVVGSSGKFNQPTKIPGKNYFKVSIYYKSIDIDTLASSLFIRTRWSSVTQTVAK